MRVRKSFERKEGVRNPRLIVVAAEGRKTEKIYIEALSEAHRAPGVHVEMLEREENASSPDKVLEQIKTYQKKYDTTAEYDELWVVVDRDRWGDKKLFAVANACAQDGLRFCLSNPCFELWLLLHLEDVANYSEEDKAALAKNERKPKKTGNTWLKKKMKKVMGQYSEAKYDTSKLLPHIYTAIERAIQLDENPQDMWPKTTGTRVYLLAQSIMGAR